MIGVTFGKVFYTEVINGQSEGDRSSEVTPETWSLRGGVVSIRLEVSNELLVG